MMRLFPSLTVVALLAGVAFSQPADTDTKVTMGASLPSFEIADVHSSPRSNNFNRFMSGPSVHAGRYVIRTATMLDLISTAYNMAPERVYGGPSWLEMDRFDLVAKLPPGSNRDSQKLMLKSLLAERFKLALHDDSKPMAAYALTAAKRSQLKEADGSGEPGCKFEVKGLPNGGPPAEGANAPIPELEYTCRNMTMAAFVDQMRTLPAISDLLNNRPVVDQTALQGSWDFAFKFPIPRRFMGPNAQTQDNTSLFDALEKQAGLKLESVKQPLPVIVVDSVNERPTANSPDVASVLAGSTLPTEFDAAAIKPTDPEFKGLMLNIDKSGTVNIKGATLKFMIEQAWNLTDDMLVGAPKWLDGDDNHWDIIAKPPSAALTIGVENVPPIDFDTVLGMLKTLLIERFKMQVHMEDRPISAYTLMAAKPKMKAADPAGRTKCFEGPGPDGKDPREANPVLGRLITCQNMPMATFADMLQGLAPGYIHSPVNDATALEGTWDFTLSFSPVGQVNGRGGRGGDGAASAGPGGTVSAQDPNGALSLLDALPKQLGVKLEMQKRPIKVLVIDHVDQKPTEN